MRCHTYDNSYRANFFKTLNSTRISHTRRKLEESSHFLMKADKSDEESVITSDSTSSDVDSIDTKSSQRLESANKKPHKCQINLIPATLSCTRKHEMSKFPLFLKYDSSKRLLRILSIASVYVMFMSIINGYLVIEEEILKDKHFHHHGTQSSKKIEISTADRPSITSVSGRVVQGFSDGLGLTIDDTRHVNIENLTAKTISSDQQNREDSSKYNIATQSERKKRRPVLAYAKNEEMLDATQNSPQKLVTLAQYQYKQPYDAAKGKTQEFILTDEMIEQSQFDRTVLLPEDGFIFSIGILLRISIHAIWIFFLFILVEVCLGERKVHFPCFKYFRIEFLFTKSKRNLKGHSR